MKIINRVTAILLSLIILVPSVLLWVNLSFAKTSVFSLLTALRSRQSLSHGLSVSTQEIDKAASDYIGFHNSFVNVYGLEMRMSGTRLVHVGNRVVLKLDSGAICEYNLDPESVKADAQTAKKNAASLAALKEKLDQQGIPLVFVLAPNKLDENNPGLPYQLNDYSNVIADDFLQELDTYGIDHVDLREVWRQNGWSRTDGFFYSDMHWRPEYAIRSWGYVTQYLNDRYGIRNDPALFDMQNQTVEKYEHVSLGDTGRIIGRFYAKIDDTELYMPNYDTHFHLVNKRVGWDKTGSYEETTVDRSSVDCGDLFVNGLLGFYYARDSVVENENAPNDANVVFIRDSFGGSLGGYVPLAFKNTSIIDLRTMNERPGETVQSIIDGFDTDIVVVFYHVGMVPRDNMFVF